jgi:hypothetical protein
MVNHRQSKKPAVEKDVRGACANTDRDAGVGEADLCPTTSRVVPDSSVRFRVLCDRQHVGSAKTGHSEILGDRRHPEGATATEGSLSTRGGPVTAARDVRTIRKRGVNGVERELTGKPER